jgi:hypothetical protein
MCSLIQQLTQLYLHAISCVTPVPIARLKKTAGFRGRFGLDAPFFRSGDQHGCVKHLSLGPPLKRCLAHCFLINESVA